MSEPSFATADLSDAHDARVSVLPLQLRDFGGRTAFHGEISTVRAFEDNSRVREAVNEPGRGRVLFVDGGGSLARSMLGDLLAQKAVDNGWSGVVVLGAIRDTAVIATLDLGVKALGTVPRKTERKDLGERDVALDVGGIAIRPGQWLYADTDGLLVADAELSPA
ncbi:MAG TPA: ribonuclease E activity regulator RraA [Xanthomonadaceae bacterium]|nr:ribonuclease E activity regulator RraA [Xanthomonadaceae bacterium]